MEPSARRARPAARPLEKVEPAILIGLPALVLALALPPGSPEPLPSAPASASASPSPVPATPPPAPSESATPAAPALPPAPAPPEPSAGPSGTAVPEAVPPTATPSPYHYRFVPRQPAEPAPGAPQIFAVYLNSKTLVSGGEILIKVSTDPGTVKVTTRSGGRLGVIPMVAPGDFETSGKLPKIPFIASGMTVALEFIALGPDGRRVSVTVPVALR